LTHGRGCVRLTSGSKTGTVAVDREAGGRADAAYDQSQRRATMDMQGQARIVSGVAELAAEIDNGRIAPAGQAERGRCV
jgi:hypothetical protein